MNALKDKLSDASNTKTRLLVLAVFFVVPTLIVILMLSKREPRYEGKTAFAWFQEMKPLQQSTNLEALRKMGRHSLAVLVEELNDSHPNNRYKAAWALGQLGPDARDTSPDLIGAMHDANNSVRYYAIQSLNAIGATNEALYPALFSALADGNKSVSANAAEMLNKLEREQSDARLQPQLTNQVEYAKAFLRSPSSQVRLMGVERLGLLIGQGDKVVPLLIALTNDSDKSIRENAKMYLRQFASHSPQ
jgi:HEAT repeat protein